MLPVIPAEHCDLHADCSVPTCPPRPPRQGLSPSTPDNFQLYSNSACLYTHPCYACPNLHDYSCLSFPLTQATPFRSYDPLPTNDGFYVPESICFQLCMFPPPLRPKSWQFSGQMQGDGAQEMGGRQPRRKVKMEALHMRLEPHRVDKAWIQERQEPRMGCCSESCGCLSWGWSHCWTRAGCWVGSSWGSHSYIQWLQSWLSHQQSLILSLVRKKRPWGWSLTRMNSKARISPNPGGWVLPKVGWRPRPHPLELLWAAKRTGRRKWWMKMKPPLPPVSQDQGVPKPSCCGCKDGEAVSTTHSGKPVCSPWFLCFLYPWGLRDQLLHRPLLDQKSVTW